MLITAAHGRVNMKKTGYTCLILVGLMSLHTVMAAGDDMYGPPNATYLPHLEVFLFEGTDGEKGYSYDPLVRPDLFNTLDLTSQFYLLGVREVNEKKGTIIPSGILVMQWKDIRLKWNPAEFGNITKTVFDGYKVWSPKFIHNGDRPLPQAEAVIHADVSSNGDVNMVLSLHEELPCRFDMTEFPFDTQQCYIHLYHPDPMVILHATGAGISVLSDTIEKGTHRHLSWDILNVTLNPNRELSGPDDTDIYIATITMKRDAKIFKRIYVTPVCFVLLLVPVLFLLPPDSNEKFTYGAVLFLCMLFITQTVESIYPPYSVNDATPVLIKLTNASSGLLFACILVTSFISTAQSICKKKAMSLCSQKYILGILGPIMLVRRNKTDIPHSTDMLDSDSRMFIINNSTVSLNGIEQNGRNSHSTENGTAGDSTVAMQALANELKQTRFQAKNQDDWNSLFIIINRFLFLITLIMAIVIIFCLGV